MRRILIINTGGTFSSVKSEGGLTPGLGEHDILAELKTVAKDCELKYEDFCSLDSANILPEHWAGLAKRIEAASREYSGIVVIHGTDTMAYTASALSFMLEPAASCPFPIRWRMPWKTAGRLFTWQTAAVPGCLWLLTARLCWECGPPR